MNTAVDATIDMRIVPMDGPFGAQIRGVDLSQPMPRKAFLGIARALRDHHVLVFEHQNLDKAQYLAFGRQWGQPILFFNPSHREQAFPELITIHNRPDTAPRQKNAAMQWHVDSSYEIPPAAVTMLHGIEAPSKGNETLFLDMAAAYDALPESMKARIEGLVVRHGLGDPRFFLEGEYRGRDENLSPERLNLRVHHPLVMPHPQTGRKVIYAPGGSPMGIVGMPDEEAIALLRALKVHSIRPEFMLRAAAQAGSVVIWDNYAVMHSATPTVYSDADGERRLLYRISTREMIAL
ncbi:MAG: TauD/TfdA dioxygenase family protein [Gammaproteobacteria bacterium]